MIKTEKEQISKKDIKDIKDIKEDLFIIKLMLILLAVFIGFSI